MNEQTVLCVTVISGLLRLEQLKWLLHNLDLIYWRLREHLEEISFWLPLPSVLSI